MQLSAFPFSTILFDLDGTLVDSAPDVLEAIAAVLRDAGDPVPRMALSIIGPPLEGIFREVCPDADEAKIARHVAAFRDLYFGGTFPQSTPYPGIFALLERLRAKGCRLFVATHKPEAAAQRMLTLKGFMPFLEGVGCTDSLPGRQLCKKDIIRLCERHRDMAFHAFTNGTLIDDDFCRELLRVGNFFVSVSIEGFEEANDGRRGEGHFQKALAAMELMHRYKIPFGVSICYTAKNYKTVTSDEFLDLLISKGCVFAWYFHYMPVGMGASTDLLLTPEQRTYMKNRVREIRGVTGGKELYCIDFQNDGEFAGGCVAGGRIYCHINAAGDVEPCVFIHYSGANIREKSFLECLQQPLFLEYRKGQPFNGNHLRPCPMLENPDLLPEMVKRSGARSTDLEAPESAEHLCEKCKAYAACWQPTAEQLWDEEHRQ